MSGGIVIITAESFCIADLLARRGYDLNLVARLAIHAGGSIRRQGRRYGLLKQSKGVLHIASSSKSRRIRPARMCAALPGASSRHSSARNGSLARIPCGSWRRRT